MKAKTSPTSPKSANQNDDKAFETVYRDSLSTIDKPIKQKNSGNIWMLFFVVILGFLAGVISQLVILSYGSSIPFIGKLDFFSYLSPGNTITISKQSPSAVPSLTQLQGTVASIAPSVVSIYKKKGATDGINGIYTNAERLGAGLILSEDGYVVSLQSISNSSDPLVVVLPTGEVLEVKEKVNDPASPFVFLKIEARNLHVVPFALQENILQLQPVVLLSLDRINESPSAVSAAVTQTNYISHNAISDYIESSDSYSRALALNQQSNSIVTSSIAFSQDGEAIGVALNTNGQSVLYPFYEIQGIIDIFFSSKSISRPFLGVKYIDLSGAAYISPALTQNQVAGALIISNDEKSIPSIVPKSPAQLGGLRKGDVIKKINGQILTSQVKLSDIVLSMKSGESVNVSYLRGGQEQETKIILSQNINRQ